MSDPSLSGNIDELYPLGQVITSTKGQGRHDKNLSKNYNNISIYTLHI